MGLETSMPISRRRENWTACNESIVPRHEKADCGRSMTDSIEDKPGSFPTRFCYEAPRWLVSGAW